MNYRLRMHTIAVAVVARSLALLSLLHARKKDIKVTRGTGENYAMGWSRYVPHFLVSYRSVVIIYRGMQLIFFHLGGVLFKKEGRLLT
jgi:hypothetical protein